MVEVGTVLDFGEHCFMTSVKKIAVLVALIGLGCALGLAILFVQSKITESSVWVSGMGAVVAITALANTVLLFAMTDERAQFTNAFAIAKQWNEEPMLSARQTIKPFLGGHGRIQIKP